MAKYSVREVIEMALQTEKLGYAFYNQMAEKFGEHEGLTKLFKTLATMEVRHEQVFSKILEKITDAEPAQWDEAQPYFRAMVESEFFLGTAKALPNLDHVKTVYDAATFALNFEKETLLFFMGMRNAVTDKAPVDEIIAEETSHITWLSSFRSAL
jgi:rubrerythrin